MRSSFSAFAITFALAALANAAEVEAEAENYTHTHRDTYAAQACDQAVEQLQQRVDAIRADDQVQSELLSSSHGYINDMNAQIQPINSQAIFNDSKTSNNSQTYENQQAQLTYL